MTVYDATGPGSDGLSLGPAAVESPTVSVEETAPTDDLDEDTVAALAAAVASLNEGMGFGSLRGDRAGKPAFEGEDCSYVLSDFDLKQLAGSGFVVADLAPGDVWPGVFTDVHADFLVNVTVDVGDPEAVHGARTLACTSVKVIDPPDAVGLAHCGCAF